MEVGDTVAIGLCMVKSAGTAYLQAVFDASPDAIITLDAHGHVRDWNPSAERIFGWTRGEAIGRPIAGLIIPAGKREAHEAGLQRLRAGGTSHLLGRRVELEALHKSGRSIMVELSLARYTVSGRPYFTAIIHDITQRLETQERAQQFGRLLELSHNEFYIIDGDSLRFINANQGALEKLGYTLAELQRMTPADITDTFDLGQVHKRVEPLIRGEQKLVVVEMRHICKDGGAYPVEVHLSRSEIGGKTLIVAVALDLTERLSIRKRMIQAERLSVAGQLAAGVAHEVNNPLTIILGLAEVLSFEEDLPERIKEDLGTILLQAKRAGKITQGMLRIGRSREHNRKRHDLRALAEGAVSLVRHYIQKGKAEWETDLSSEPVWVFVDEEQVHEIVINLIINAVDAMAQSDVRRLTLRVARSPVGGTLAVQDTGPGIGAEILPRIFEPFVTSKAVGKGTGLGLYICSGLALDNGGSLEVDSKPGQGAVFTLSLPVHEPAKD